MKFKELLLIFLVVILTSCVRSQAVLFPDKVNKANEIDSRVQIAISYLQQDDTENAMQQLKIARDIDHKSPRVNEVLALTLEKMGETEKAKEYFKKMLKYDSAYTRGRANYGSFLMHIEDYKEAYAQFSAVVEDIYYSKRSLAYFQMGQCAEKLGKMPEMRAAYQKALDINNTFAPALLELVAINFNNKEYPEALKLLDRYRAEVDQPGSRALLYGIKLSRIFEDKNSEASYVLALKNLYPKSAEYLEYIKTIR